MAGPLTGIRIVEMDGLGPVPFAALFLADLGADIVRIARRAERGGDVIGDAGGTLMNRGRPVVTLDLRREEDREAALALIARADALIEGFRPGVMERLGLSPETCLTRNPRLVYGRMTGWGQDGPLSARAGHDITYLALTGALGAMGDRDRPPTPPLNLVADFGGGAMLLVAGLLAALLEAARSGRGQVIDAAMTDGAALLMGMAYAFRNAGRWSDARGDNLLDGGAPYYACYACADGRHVAVGALEPQFFAQLVAGLGLDPADFDQAGRASWPAMREAFARAFAARPRDEWIAIFQGTDACVAPVLAMEEAPRHPHNAARGTFLPTSEGPVPAPAPRFSRTPAARGAAPEVIDAATALSRWSMRHDATKA